MDARGDELLVLNEVYFPGWMAKVDGASAPVVEVAGGLRAVRVAGDRGDYAALASTSFSSSSSSSSSRSVATADRT